MYFSDRIIKKQTFQVNTPITIVKLNDCAIQLCTEFNLSVDSVWLVNIKNILKIMDEVILTNLNNLFDIYEYDKGAISNAQINNFPFKIKPTINIPYNFYETFGIGECIANGDRIILVYKNHLPCFLSEAVTNDKNLLELLNMLNISKKFYTILDFFYDWKMFKYVNFLLYFFSNIYYYNENLLLDADIYQKYLQIIG